MVHNNPQYTCPLASVQKACMRTGRSSAGVMWVISCREPVHRQFLLHLCLLSETKRLQLLASSL